MRNVISFANAALIMFLILISANAHARFDTFLEYENFKTSSEYQEVNSCSLASMFAQLYESPLDQLKAMFKPAALQSQAQSQATSALTPNQPSVSDGSYFSDTQQSAYYNATAAAGALSGVSLSGTVDQYIINTSELNQTFIPDVISSNNLVTQHFIPGEAIYKAAKRTISATAFIGSMAGASTYGLVGGFIGGAAVMGFEAFRIMDACSNYYIIQPYELVANNRGSAYWNIQTCTPNLNFTATSTAPSCTVPNVSLSLSKNAATAQANCNATNSNVSGKYYNAAPCMLTETEVPYYYHCDPAYDPLTGANLLDGSNGDLGWKVGYTQGYMGAASQYCTGDAKNNAQKDLIGKIVMQGFSYSEILLCYISKSYSWAFGGNKCPSRLDMNDSNRTKRTLSPGDQPIILPTGISVSSFMPFYRFSDSGERNASGQLQRQTRLCVATIDTFLPVLIGCAPVAPPLEPPNSSPFDQFIKGTRCEYIGGGTEHIKSSVRPDLTSLGNYIGSKITNPKDPAKQVRNFLQGDLHFASTTVGCIKDLTLKLFVPSEGSVSAFQKIQKSMTPIILAAFTLFICLTGIHIMISGEEPNRKQLVGFLLKAAFVYFFALGDVWYSANYGASGGLITVIYAAQDMFASWIIATNSQFDYLNACTYNLPGVGNIFTDTVISCDSNAITACEATKNLNNYNNIIMTIWDLVDCKLGNYWNLGSCDFSASGILVVSWVVMLLLTSPIAFLFGLVMLIYFFISFEMIVKFVNAVIISVLIIAVLTITAPIFVTFALFEQTKDITQNWIKMMMGYTLYPAVISVFIVVFIGTFDSIYYGFTNPVNSIDIADLTAEGGVCYKNNSVYCTFLSVLSSAAGGTVCDMWKGSVSTHLINPLSVSSSFIIKFSYPVSIFIPSWPQVLVLIELLFLSLLFNFIAASTMEFLGTLVNIGSGPAGRVAGMMDGAKGAANLAKDISGGVKKAVGAIRGGGRR